MLFKNLLLFLFFGLLSACVLDNGENRRDEITLGLYVAQGNEAELRYDFHADGTFTFERFDSTRLTIKETGNWRYRYVNPQERYLDELNVIRQDLNSVRTWTTQDSVHYSYRIIASTPDEFHINPGIYGGPGLFLLFSIFLDNEIIFERH